VMTSTRYTCEHVHQLAEAGTDSNGSTGSGTDPWMSITGHLIAELVLPM
jgi:hypothetical protein